MSGKPMDPERLAAIRALPACGPDDFSATISVMVLLPELLADRDHWEAEYTKAHEFAEKCLLRMRAAEAREQRYRSRCPVTAEDCATARLTWEKVDAWVQAQPDGDGVQATDGRPLDSWRRVRENPDGPTWQLGVGMVIHRGQALCDVVRFVAPLSGRPAWDILDEMATATPGGDR